MKIVIQVAYRYAPGYVSTEYEEMEITEIDLFKYAQDKMGEKFNGAPQVRDVKILRIEP